MHPPEGITFEPSKGAISKGISLIKPIDILIYKSQNGAVQGSKSFTASKQQAQEVQARRKMFL